MLEAKNLGHIKYTAAELAIKIKASSVLAQLGEAFFKNPTDTTALEIFRILASSQHMGGKAVDFSGLNDPDLKWDLAYFLHKRTTYTVLFYQKPYIISKHGIFSFYKQNATPDDSYVRRAMREYRDTWFFHADKR